MSSTPPTTTRPATNGTLARTPLAHLFVYALDKGLTGTFELTCTDGQHATVSVRSGLVSKVRTSKAVVYLGPLLYEMGVIDDQELNASLVDVAEKRELHGRILLDRGWITEEMLNAALREQTLRKLAHLFAFPPDTTFTFLPDVDLLAAYGGESGMLIDPFPSIWRGVREYPSDEHVRAVVSRIDSCACRLAASAELARFELQGDEQTAADALRLRPMTLADLAEFESFGQRRAELLLYCFLITKQIDLVKAETLVTLTPPQSFRPSGAARAAREKPISFVLRAAAPPSVPAPISSSPRGASSSPPRTVSSSPPRARASNSSRNVTSMSSSLPVTGPAQSDARPDEELAERRSMARARARTIQSEDHYARLGVPRDARPEEIDKAFTELRTIWDPTSLPPQLDDAQEDFWFVLSCMAEAHSTLLDPVRSVQYARALRAGPATVRDLYGDDLEACGASDAFEGAKTCLARADLERAERLCRRAHKADPERAEVLALLAWLEALRPSNQSPEATRVRISMLDRAIALDDTREDAFFWRAQLHKRVENHLAAMRDFKRVTLINEKNLDALRELRLYELRVRRNSVSMRPVH